MRISDWSSDVCSSDLPAGRRSGGIRRRSARPPSIVAKVADEHGGEVGIARGGEHRQRVTDDPQHQAGDPLLQAEPHGRRHGAVDDGDGARRAAEQDRLGQRPVQRRLEPLDMVDAVRHQTSAPPPKLKKLRKNELAANAMVRPKTIWISRRTPQLVSPKPTVKPVKMIMITPTQ